jgi:hypothetical protein
MSRAATFARALPLVVGVVAALVVLTWALEQLMPPPYSGYLAAIMVAMIGIEIYKRRPGPRAMRMLRIYLRARARGAAEVDASRHLVSYQTRDEAARHRLVSELGTVWVGASEKKRAIEGVRFLLNREGRRLEAAALAAAYDRVRDQITVPGWDALPQEFVDAVHDRLDERERAQLQTLVARYRLLEQKFFRSPSALGADPAAGLVDFARLLHSMGNRLAKDEPGDAERAYTRAAWWRSSSARTSRACSSCTAAN